jgi:hypothetical protein
LWQDSPGLLVRRQERSSGERVPEEACRVGGNRIRSRMDRQKELVAAALRGRIRRSRSDSLSLRDESRGKLGEAVRTTEYIQAGAETKCRHMNGTSVRSRTRDTYGSLIKESATLKCHWMYRKSGLDQRVRFQPCQLDRVPGWVGSTSPMKSRRAVKTRPCNPPRKQPERRFMQGEGEAEGIGCRYPEGGVMPARG